MVAGFAWPTLLRMIRNNLTHRIDPDNPCCANIAAAI
jgi:hypothetical protein